MDWACFADERGEVVLGRGPFEERAECPREGVAFYRNDFGLTCERPWFVPAEVEVVKDLEELVGHEAFEMPEWEEVDAGKVAAVVGEVMAEFRGGQLEKSVAVVTSRGSWKGLPTHWKYLPERLARGMRLFGWGEGRKGLLSATPEQLFRLESGLLETMALAGTARKEDREVFEVDEKEIREHEFVAQTLMAKLGDLGMVRRKKRAVLDLGELIHFHTPIEVELFREEGADALVRRLHPTPALGPLPRTGETLERLLDWRRRLGCPGWFGAPFGFFRDGAFEALVGIRMVLWEGEDVAVPSGCGVIEASRLVNEWRELRLKREAVKRVFGLM
ncbi:MAG: chorismate-binding protein [Verrucomicrobiota bacterium]